MIELTGYTDKHEYTNKHGVKSVVYLMDCMDAMAQMGDKEFSLLCSDPPYGIKMHGGVTYQRPSRPNSYGKPAKHKKKDWDSNRPTADFWNEANRTTSNQIIFGANYFVENLRPSMGWIYWGKMEDESNFSDGELIYTSFDRALKSVKVHQFNGTNGGKDRMHPTQKPIALYDWIFHNYAKPNDTIFDSHLGSGSSRIAADKHNLPFLGVEKDSDYFRDHCKRFDRYTSQLTLF